MSLDLVAQVADLQAQLERLEAEREEILNNFSATSAPTANDDAGDGYSVGSMWINISTNLAYICMDNSAGAADWDQIN